MAVLKEHEAICSGIGSQLGLQRSYGNQAVILQDWGRLEEAMALHKQQEAICLELGIKEGLQACYGNQAESFRIGGGWRRRCRCTRSRKPSAWS